nr:retrovirus-related Pol polyprotein from transposon TNT 1-94 [Tanacetum cinerariifolium]
MRPFGCPVTILNTLDPLVKFEGKVDEGILVGYSVNSKAIKVFNSRTCIVQETLHVNYLENKPNVAGKTGEEANQQYMLFLVWSTGSTNPQNKGDATFDGKEHDAEKLESTLNLSPSSSRFEDYSEDSNNDVSAAGPIVPAAGQNYSNIINLISAVGPLNINTSVTHGKSSLQDASQPPDMLESEDIVYSDHENVGAEADFNNLETSITDKRGIVVRNKARLVAQGHTQKEGIDYEEVFALIAKIEAIRLFLAYASFMGFMVYQIDVKSAFLYGTIEEEVYVCQPSGFEDPDHPDKVYKVVKALYGLHQAPRAWIQALVDKKKVVVTEATIRDALHLDDVEGVDCLPNEEIFTTLARMGYEKPSTKLTFYKAFFSSDLSTHSTKYISPALTQKVFANMKRVGKGCSGVKTPLFEGMLVAREPENQGNAEEQGDAKE